MSIFALSEGICGHFYTFTFCLSPALSANTDTNTDNWPYTTINEYFCTFIGYFWTFLHSNIRDRMRPEKTETETETRVLRPRPRLTKTEASIDVTHFLVGGLKPPNPPPPPQLEAWRQDH